MLEVLLEKICAEKEGKGPGKAGLSLPVPGDGILAAGAALSLHSLPGRLREINILGTASGNANSSHSSFFPLLSGSWGFEHHQGIPDLAQQSCLLAVPLLRAVLLNLAAA